jgi:excisionase family DNA binding protein
MRYLTTRQVADHFGVHPKTVSRWVKSGQLSHAGKLAGLRGAYLFDPGVIDDITQQRQEANT